MSATNFWYIFIPDNPSIVRVRSNGKNPILGDDERGSDCLCFNVSSAWLYSANDCIEFEKAIISSWFHVFAAISCINLLKASITSLYFSLSVGGPGGGAGWEGGGGWVVFGNGVRKFVKVELSVFWNGTPVETGVWFWVWGGCNGAMKAEGEG